MTLPQSGWYPDPSGDQTRIRYWNGTEWTDDYMNAYAQPSQATQATQPSNPFQPQSSAAPFAETAATPTAASDQYAAPNVPPSPYEAPSATPYNPYNQPPQPDYTTQTAYYSPQPYNIYTGEGMFPQTQEDRTLRLIAFILCLLSIVSTGWAIFPLAWMIPMTVHLWGIYKGKNPNTVAFGVCTLLFVNIVAGILLLISHKDA